MATAAPPYVALTGVTKTYRRAGREDTHALERIDLSIREGEFLAIVGPSGCGKSTLLRLVAGLEAASEGALFTDGRAIEGLHDDTRIMFQEARLLPWRHVLDNVTLQGGGTLTGTISSLNRPED